MKIEIGNKKINDLTDDNILDIMMIIGCIPALEYWDKPIITRIDKEKIDKIVVVDYHSLRTEDNIKSQNFTLFINFKDYRYHYTNDFFRNSDYKPNGQRFCLNIIKYLIEIGFDVPIY